MSCLPHSAAQASHTEAQTPHIAAACSEPRAISPTAVRHAAAQSMSSAMQRAIACTSGSRRQALAQWSHASAQALQASMQDAKRSWDIMGSTGVIPA